MKKMFISLALITAMLVSSVGATMAVFSDQGKILGNSFSTATVNIDLRALGSGQISKPISLTGMIPGMWSDWGRVEVYNESNSTPVKAYFYVENLSGAACNKVNLKLATGHAGSLVSESAITIYDGALSGIAGAGNRVAISGPGMIFNPTIPVNTTAVVTQRAQLDATASNAYQNTTCTWDEVFVAETP